MKKLNTVKVLLSCLYFISVAAHGQQGSAISPAAIGATDGRDVQIFPSKDTQTEVTIIINKKNPQNLIASCNTFGAGSNHYFNQGYFSTHDGGAHWTGSDYIPGLDPSAINQFSTPSLAFTTDTVAIKTTAKRAFGYYLNKSYNGGISFTTPVTVDSNSIYVFDPRIAVDDAPASQYKNNFYAAWVDGFNETIGFNRSTDAARTFSNEITVGPAGGQGPSVQTGVNGEVYVCWANGDPSTGCGFTKSLDGGITFTPSTIAFPYAGIRTDYTSYIFNFTRTVDFPSMAVDKSNGAHRGRIYIAYPSKETGKAVIYVRYSDDKGATWSAGKAVSITNASQSFLPSITVDDVTGNVYVDYFAFDNPNVSYSTNTYMAGSANGGTIWRNLKVSDAPHITHAVNNNAFEEGTYGRYIGIAAYNNIVYPAWMDSRTGTYQIYVSKETIGSGAGAVEDNAWQPIASIKPIEKMLVSPNPFITTLHLLLPANKIEHVELYDQSGKLVQRWEKPTSDALTTNAISRGIYMLHVTDKQQALYTQKLAKE